MTALHWLALVAVAAWSIGAVSLLRSRTGPVAGRFFRHPGTSLALTLLLFFATLAVFAPLLAPYRPSLQLDIVGLQNRPPSIAHPLGTDLYSRDVWSRLLFGARISLGLGVLAMLIAVVLGAAVGSVAGYFRSAIDAVLMRLVDVGLAVPRIFIVFVVIALWGTAGVGAIALLLGLTSWFGTSRLVRAEVLSLRTRTFVDAALASGAGPWRVIGRHLLPNAAAPLIVSVALGIGNVMLLEAGLSFLGVGVQPPLPSWGNMIADGRDQLVAAPWISLFPGLAIALVVMSLNAVGDGLRDALDPRNTTG